MWTPEELRDFVEEHRSAKAAARCTSREEYEKLAEMWITSDEFQECLKNRAQEGMSSMYLCKISGGGNSSYAEGHLRDLRDKLFNKDITWDVAGYAWENIAKKYGFGLACVGESGDIFSYCLRWN